MEQTESQHQLTARLIPLKFYKGLVGYSIIVPVLFYYPKLQFLLDHLSEKTEHFYPLFVFVFVFYFTAPSKTTVHNAYN